MVYNKSMTRFKEYNVNQMNLLLSLEDFIPENHLVRVVNKVVDTLELSSMNQPYIAAAKYGYFHPQTPFRAISR